MKLLSVLLLALFHVSASSQTLESIKDLIVRVDHTTFTDSIVVNDSTNRIIGPSRIAAYLVGDTLMKSIVTFSNYSRVRITYYRHDPQYHDEVQYVREYDGLTREPLTEIYGYDHTVYESTINKPLGDDEKRYPYLLLQHADYSIRVRMALVDRMAKKYHFRVKLTKALPLPGACGFIAFAILQKFEVLSTDCPYCDKQFVLIIQPCPDFFEKNFFQDSAIYEVDVATNSGATFGYAYYNNYENEDLPVFWSRNIEKEK